MKSDCRSLIPLGPAQLAMLRAIGDTERRRQHGKRIADYPYAQAFFRNLNGSRRASLSDFRFFSPALTADELRGCRSQWLNAVDVLIETRGDVCCLPLPFDAVAMLFSAPGFRTDERQRQKKTLADLKYTRQMQREAVIRERTHAALLGQAEIDLAFHTPSTVGSWLSRWSGGVIEEYELENLFFNWSEKFPSLNSLERWQWRNMPLWRVIYEASCAGKDASPHIQALERWMVPNKLGLAC